MNMYSILQEAERENRERTMSKLMHEAEREDVLRRTKPFAPIYHDYFFYELHEENPDKINKLINDTNTEIIDFLFDMTAKGTNDTKNILEEKLDEMNIGSIITSYSKTDIFDSMNDNEEEFKNLMIRKWKLTADLAKQSNQTWNCKELKTLSNVKTLTFKDKGLFYETFFAILEDMYADNQDFFDFVSKNSEKINLELFAQKYLYYRSMTQIISEEFLYKFRDIESFDINTIYDADTDAATVKKYIKVFSDKIDWIKMSCRLSQSLADEDEIVEYTKILMENITQVNWKIFFDGSETELTDNIKENLSAVEKEIIKQNCIDNEKYTMIKEYEYESRDEGYSFYLAIYCEDEEGEKQFIASINV